MNKAVFLDRDGTINVEKNYLYKIEEFEFIDGTIDAIKMLKDAGYKIIVITNQAGIGRGYYTEADLHKLHNWINNTLKLHDTEIDDFYYCPHHPEHGIGQYKQICDCRKPGTKLYVDAINKHNIDVTKSYVIGDKLTDLIPGIELGIKTILVHTGYGIQERNNTSVKYCFQYNNLKQAAEFITRLQR